METYKTRDESYLLLGSGAFRSTLLHLQWPVDEQISKCYYIDDKNGPILLWDRAFSYR